MTTMQTPTVYPTVSAMLADATDRVEVRSSDAKSGSTFERLRIGGERYFLKSLSHDEDWIMRITGDVDHRPLLSWRAGLYHQTPDCIDHTIVAMAIEGSGTNARLSMLMHDVGEHLIPEGDDVVALDMHESLIDHMAAMHAHFLGWTDNVGLVPLAHRFRFFAPDNIAGELHRPDVSPVITIADQGWRMLPDRAPRLATIAAAIHAEPQLLTTALSTTPSTFVAGDWKMGNLGHHPDGRTILLDWAYPGAAPVCEYASAIDVGVIVSPINRSACASRARHGPATSATRRRRRVPSPNRSTRRCRAVTARSADRTTRRSQLRGARVRRGTKRSLPLSTAAIGRG